MNYIHTKTALEMDLFYRIDINLYPLFITIYEQQSISKAAEHLHISQSAVSHALQKLRDHLQDELFIRANRKMNPTPFAEQIYPKIKEALINLQNISINRKKFEMTEIKSLRIAIHDEIEPLVFPKLVKHFKSLNIDIQFQSSKLDRKTIVTDLASQQIDFAIDLEYSVDSKTSFDLLMQDHFVACSMRNTINKEIYLSSQHIGVSSRRTGTLVEDIFLAKHKYSRDILLRCQHYSTALQLLEQYPDAILTLPSYILRESKKSESIFSFNIPIDLPILNIGLYWNINFKSNQRLSFLRSEILKIFA